MEAVGDLVPPVDVYQQLKYSLLAGHCLTETQRMGRVPNFERNNYFEEDQTRRNGPVQCFVGIPPVSRNKKLMECDSAGKKKYRNFVSLQYLRNFVPFQTFFTLSNN